MGFLRNVGTVVLAGVLLLGTDAHSQHPRSIHDYPWLADEMTGTVAERFQPPDGYHRTDEGPESFSRWLRGLPLKPGRGTVHLYDGSAARDQENHVAVLAVDIGSRDLQQCADAIIRLRAEYLREVGREDEIAFRFTSGDLASWTDWRAGMRPGVSENRVTWTRSAEPDSTYAAFRDYLDTVFIYAGTASLIRELEPVEDATAVVPGDVFIIGGFPGHALIVIDVADSNDGDRVFMLAQSLLPAREIHIVRGGGPLRQSPWFEARREGMIHPAGWRFEFSDLRRFPATP
ncbi:MAG: DUF4846 domain-containing protein [Candidatus Eisenbacteria sp.]|nr:DUF4846 domain-containing protein [Candidatus Eisenbacteria bacterium]